MLKRDSPYGSMSLKMHTQVMVTAPSKWATEQATPAPYRKDPTQLKLLQANNPLMPILGQDEGISAETGTPLSHKYRKMRIKYYQPRRRKDQERNTQY